MPSVAHCWGFPVERGSSKMRNPIDMLQAVTWSGHCQDVCCKYMSVPPSWLVFLLLEPFSTGKHLVTTHHMYTGVSKQWAPALSISFHLSSTLICVFLMIRRWRGVLIVLLLQHQHFRELLWKAEQLTALSEHICFFQTFNWKAHLIKLSSILQ